MQVIAGAEQGGAEAFFERLVPALSRAGVDQYAAIRTHPARAGKLGAAGVPVAQFRFGSPLDVSTRLGLRRLARRFRPDVVMTWMNRASRLCPRGPYVRLGRLGGYYDLKYYRGCDHLAILTEDLKKHVVDNGFPADRVHCVPNFADETPATPMARTAFETPETGRLILAAGRLHRNKGFDTLIRAMSRLPGTYLWLAGEGPERTALTELATQLDVAGRVRFLGWREDVPALLGAADVFVCSSRHEPFGSILVEAWARAVPLIAAASQGPRAIMTDGVDGVLVPIDDADALAEAIGRVLDDPALAKRLAAAGHAAYVARFSEAAVVRAYLDLFERLLGHPADAARQPGETAAVAARP
ncbi:MAG: glycosyltransferase [Rhodospirillales bacterium]|nr:MAG: glycosyltransferase [Rhodospirillales bacterium]